MTLVSILPSAVLVGYGGLFTVLVGYLIKYHGMVHLIAGYDPEQVADEKGLADGIGTFVIVVGCVTTLIGVLELQGIATAALWYGYVVFVVGSVGGIVVLSRRYTV